MLKIYSELRTIYIPVTIMNQILLSQKKVMNMLIYIKVRLAWTYLRLLQRDQMTFEGQKDW